MHLTHLKMVAGLVALAAMVVTAAVPVATSAQDKKVTVYVFPHKKKDRAAARSFNILLKKNMASVENMTFKDLAQPMDEATSENIDEMLDAGYAAMEKKNFAQAEKELGNAMALLEKGIATPDIRSVARICKGLGIAKVMTGKQAEGDELIHRSIVIWPTQNGGEYELISNEAKASFLKGITKFENTPSGTLKVSASEEDATVFVDREFKGFTPLDVTNLPPGKHYVRVVKDGYFQSGAFVEVGSATTSKHDVTLTPITDHDKFAKAAKGVTKKNNFKAGTIDPMVKDIKDAAGADEILLVRVADVSGTFELKGFYGTIDGSVYDFEQPIDQDADFFDNLANFIMMQTGNQVAVVQESDKLEKAEVQAAAVTQPTDMTNAIIMDPSQIFKDDKKKESSIFSEWWFWTAVGVVAAGVGTGLFFLTRDSGDTGVGPTGTVSISLTPLQ